VARQGYDSENLTPAIRAFECFQSNDHCGAASRSGIQCPGGIRNHTSFGGNPDVRVGWGFIVGQEVH
jgi:hypothetical protein